MANPSAFNIIDQNIYFGQSLGKLNVEPLG